MSDYTNYERCRFTGKVSFPTAPIAVEELRKWLRKNRDAAQDASRLGDPGFDTR